MISLIAFIKTTPTEVVPSPPIKPLNETLEILTKVNEFYDSAWSKLIFLLAGTFTLLSIIIPFIIQHFQNKSLKASEKELEGIINLKIFEAKEEIKNEMEEKLNSSLKLYEKKIESFKKGAKGHSLHLQANFQIEKKNYFQGLKDYARALECYIISNDKTNIKTSLLGISFCLDEISSEDLEALKRNYNIDILEELAKLESHEDFDFYIDLITEIKEKIFSK